MTSIKPPTTGPLGPPQLGESVTPSAAESSANASFANALESARSQDTGASTAQAAATRQTGETPALGEVAAQRGADPVAGLVQDIEAGRLGMDQAVDQLMQQALEHVGKQLSGEQRAELTGLLRDALAHDPTLRALRDERG